MASVPGLRNPVLLVSLPCLTVSVPGRLDVREGTDEEIAERAAFYRW